MSTILKKEEKIIAEKYLDFCKSFGILPTKNYKELIAQEKKKTGLYHKDSENRREVLALYKKQCEKFNIPYSSFIDEKSTGEIWDYVFRDIENAIQKEFGKEFLKINDIILRKKIKIALETLYDEGIYVKKEQTPALFACENDNDEIQEEYEKLGGKEKLLALSETSSYFYDEEENEKEEEVPEDEEDF